MTPCLVVAVFLSPCLPVSLSPCLLVFLLHSAVQAFASSQHWLDLVYEVTHVRELTVDRGETDVGNLIKILQVFHDQFAENRHGDFTEVIGIDIALDLPND